MKHFIGTLLVVALLAAIITPAYALDKRQQNNKNIAEFISDTVKLPMVILGIFVKHDPEKVQKDLNHKDNQGLEKCLRK